MIYTLLNNSRETGLVTELRQDTATLIYVNVYLLIYPDIPCSSKPEIRKGSLQSGSNRTTFDSIRFVINLNSSQTKELRNF